MITPLILILLSGPVQDPWDFEGERAHIVAEGEPKDEMTMLAFKQLGVALKGDAFLKVSAHPNSVGGVTLRLTDFNDDRNACELYAQRDKQQLKFDDVRCSFIAFGDQAKTLATCRRITGTAQKLKRGIAFKATSPDCTAQPMGLPLAGRAWVKPATERE